MSGLFRGLVIVVVFALAAPAAAAARDVRVVVELDAPGLARSVESSRVLTSAAKQRRLDLASGSAYLRSLAARQDAFAVALRRAIPRARVGWRYRITLNGVSVTLPERDVDRLERVAGVRAVYRSTTYRRQLDRSPGLIGAPQLWNDPSTPSRGDGIKIGVLDDGIDHTHPFFAPSGYSMPAGFPRGQAAFTSAKVIVARAFAPPGIGWRHARSAFDPENSAHGTHVAGIAAGNANTPTSVGGLASGVAPRAYLGNYKVMTVPSEQFGLNGNAPEIVRGIEAAVADGMDVINVSLGQPEVEPSRDVVALALDGAAAAGVVPVTAAGNDFRRAGRGSIISPATSERAIAVGASEEARDVAAFSSAGPTPLSLRLKPDVVAPGFAVLSSVPGEGPTLWTLLSGTSMAAPHVAGAAALLRQRHRDWNVAQLKAALTATANPIGGAASTRIGGGLVDLPEADAPRIFATPSTVSFGVVRPGTTLRASVRLDDAGGGAGIWSGEVVAAGGRRVPVAATVPGTLAVELPAGTAQREEAGWIALRRGGLERRIPYWYAVVRPSLPAPDRTLARAGSFVGSTVGRAARVTRYRYPDLGDERVRGPEQVFRFVLGRAAANFGVAVTSGNVEPRILLERDEARVAGFTALPVNMNPYDPRFDRHTPIAAVLRPAPRTYYVVFDSHATRGSRFAFRVWVGDTRPPSVRLLTPLAQSGVARFAVGDAGSGVDASSLRASVGGSSRTVRLRGSVVSVDLAGLRSGTHTVVLSVSDRQETKNNENVAGVMPNTRTLRVRVRVP